MNRGVHRGKLGMPRRPAYLVRALCIALFGTVVAGSDVSMAQSGGKLTGAELRMALVGKTFEYRTTKIPSHDVHRPGEIAWRERTDGGWSIFRVFVRDDGSTIFRCTTHNRGGPGSPCPGRIEDVGTWSIVGDSFCSQFTSVRGSTELCYEYHRAGASLQAKQVKGPRSTMDGELISFK